MKIKKFCFKNTVLKLNATPRIMGILNVTPDSFSDGSKFYDVDKALQHGAFMYEQGADIIDVGGESTRPGAQIISPEEEINRVVPVVCGLKKKIPGAVISVDTTKSSVAYAALEAGADIINDISGLSFDPEIANAVAEYNAGLILMHTRGTPETMLELTDYSDLIYDISRFLLNAIDTAVSRGVKQESIIIDPGIGFAKNHLQNLEILNKISDFIALGYPLLVGPSRKSFIGEVLKQPDPEKRIFGTAAVSAWLAMNKVDFIRVHDVSEMKDVISLIESIIKITL